MEKVPSIGFSILLLSVQGATCAELVIFDRYFLTGIGGIYSCDF